MIPFALFILWIALLTFAFVRPVTQGNPPEHDWFFDLWSYNE